MSNASVRIFKCILQNKILTGTILIYVLMMVSVINWGIPSSDHPYNYHMDEWHQFQAIKATFKNLSANSSGSAHGTMFQFILSGVYLIPFYLFKLINPFNIRSSVDMLSEQQRIFEILRLNTIFFGAMSIFMIAKIVKGYFVKNHNIAVIIFTITPLWLSLSNYFKYDIALIFWINLALFCLLKFGEKPTLRNYLLAGFVCALAVATKISAFPLIPAYTISFFLFLDKSKRQIKTFFFGLIIFLLGVLIFGIPDLILGRGDYREFLYSNLVLSPNNYSNYILNQDWWRYLLLKTFPMDFGYSFYILSVLGIFYSFFKFFKSKLNIKSFFSKNELFMLICLFLFLVSLFPLKLEANGNRLFVLLPFFAIFSNILLDKILNKFSNFKFQMYLILVLLLIFQFLQSFSMVYIKWQADPRQQSSYWLVKNLNRGSVIGIENIPIYQLLPDLVIKEFYSKKDNNRFEYEVINSKSLLLPNVIVITNKELDFNHFKKSPKKDLLARMNTDGYKTIGEFKPNKLLYEIMGNEFDFYLSGIVPISTITIYQRDKNPQN